MAVALISAVALLSSETLSTADLPARPNILVVLTDDQPLVTEAATPRIASWFADGGTTFTNAYMTDPLCCPSRASILSGQYPHNHGVKGNQDHQGKQGFDHQRSLQAELGGADYRTGYVGKYQIESKSAPGFDSYAVTRGYSDRPTFTRRGRRGPIAYSPRFVFRRAGRLAARWSPEPWMIFVSTHTPHEPNEAESRHRHEKFPWDRPPNIHAAAEGKPDYVADSRTDPKRGAQLRQRQLRSLRTVDAGFVRLTRRLEELGQLESTLVIFLSDNGMLWGQHGLTGKIVPYQESVRVPMYMRGPGVPNRESNRLVANIDIAPTIYATAGVTPSYTVDGRHLLTGPRRQELLLEHLLDRFGAGGGMGLRNMPAWASLVTESEQYISYSTGEEELYDLESDPFQLTNLAPETDLSARREALDAVRLCAGSECP